MLAPNQVDRIVRGAIRTFIAPCVVLLMLACGPSISVDSAGEGGGTEATTAGATNGGPGAEASGAPDSSGADPAGEPACVLQQWRSDDYQYCCASLPQTCDQVSHACQGDACGDTPSFIWPIGDPQAAICQLKERAAQLIRVHVRVAVADNGELALETVHVLAPDTVVRNRWIDRSPTGGPLFDELTTEVCQLAAPETIAACLEAAGDANTLGDCLDSSLTACTADPDAPVDCPE